LRALCEKEHPDPSYLLRKQWWALGALTPFKMEFG
jgi:hypothetical protein